MPTLLPSKISPSKASASKLPTAEWNLDLLKSYTFVKELGKGATGAVALFTVNRSGRKVAIKRMVVPIQKDYQVKKLLREVHILKSLSESESGRQHVTELLDVVFEKITKDRWVVYLVLEHLPYTLKSFIDQQKHFTVEMATKILYQLLCALNFLQSARILHRDLKPENILIDDDLNVKLCDFGLARFYRKSARDHTDLSKREVAEKLRNAEGSRKERRRELSNHVVSRWYRSPEIILLERYDSKADLWSVGCILAEILMSTSAYSKEKLPSHEKILFPGLSCYPLSPKGLKKETKDYDQLPVIINILGDQEKEDVAFLTDGDVRKFVLDQNQNQPKVDFNSEFSAVDQRFSIIIENMLEFNPYFRASPKKLLKSSLFNEVRQDSLEADASCKVKLAFDEQGAYDYEKQKPINYSVSEVIEEFKLLVFSMASNQ